jgi:hypothetical protein
MHHGAWKPCPIVVKYELGCTYLRYMYNLVHTLMNGGMYEYLFLHVYLRYIYVILIHIYWVCVSWCNLGMHILGLYE